MSADWTADWGCVIHLERLGRLVMASGNTSFSGNTGNQSNLSLSRASTFPKWAWPQSSGNYIMAGSNAQLFSAYIDTSQHKIFASGNANSGYQFNVTGAWIC